MLVALLLRSALDHGCVRCHFRALHTVYDERFAETYGPWRPVMREVADKFLACGILEHGFARVRCDACAHEYLLAFSCKCRYFFCEATLRVKPSVVFCEATLRVKPSVVSAVLAVRSFSVVRACLEVLLSLLFALVCGGALVMHGTRWSRRMWVVRRSGRRQLSNDFVDLRWCCVLSQGICRARRSQFSQLDSRTVLRCILRRVLPRLSRALISCR